MFGLGRSGKKNLGLLYFSDARRLRGEADDILVAAVGEQAAVDVVRAVDGFVGCRAFRRGTMRAAFERDAHFEFAASLLVCDVNEGGKEHKPSRQDDPTSLALFRHGAMKP
jgi:hypothetical protein